MSQLAFDDVRNIVGSAPNAVSGPRYALLIPLIEGEDGLELVLELRALSLDVQPGEVCLPGGQIEADESPAEAALRETCEELLVNPDQIELIGELGDALGPGRAQMAVFVGRLSGYAGSYSPDEVDHSFTVSLDWLVRTDPDVYTVGCEPRFSDDFPWELVPGGRSYPWRFGEHEVPFYRDTNPVIWGATARVLWSFARLLRG